MSLDVASSKSRAGTGLRGLHVALLSLLLTFAAPSAADDSAIADLEALFVSLGGTVVHFEARTDYGVPGQVEEPMAVANVLRALREAHFNAVLDRDPLAEEHMRSWVRANHAGQEFLRAERDRTSLLDAYARRRVNSMLRDYYDASIDLGWEILTIDDPDATTGELVEPLFGAAELSRASDFMGSIHRRLEMDGSGRADDVLSFARFEAEVAYRQALSDLQSDIAATGEPSADVQALQRLLLRAVADNAGADLTQWDSPAATDVGFVEGPSSWKNVPIGFSLVMYHVTSRHPYAFVVTANQPPRMVRLPGTTSELRELVTSFHGALASRQPGRGAAPATESGVANSGRRLYATLIEPIEPFLGRFPATTRPSFSGALAIVPHDFLHLVPFAALPLPTAGDGAYLVDRYIAFMLPTATFLFASSLRLRLPTKVALIVGIDTFSQAGKLEHAEDEAAAVARLVEGSDLRLGSRGDGRYADIVRDLDEYSLVHIASHGAYIPHVPAASHVLLRGSRGDDDEPLTAAAVLGMRLNADLVVLSACNTATVNERGLPPDGDILGLPRSFLIAGAGGVIASLWSVDDRSTGVFFERFYRTLLDGEMPVEQALAITQRAMRLEYPDPHFWAPFVQIGVIVAPMEITD